LEARGITVRETVPSSRKLGRTEALAMVHQAQRLVAAKGKKSPLSICRPHCQQTMSWLACCSGQPGTCAPPLCE